MRVLFLGSPEFAVPSLDAVAARHDVVLVVTQPDRPSGRGLRLQPPPIAVRARALGRAVLQPEKLREIRETLEASRLDVAVTVAYGKILPRWLLDLPRHGCINVHPSLLPKYRGASPVPQAILHGDAVTGVTIIRQTEALDAGGVLLQRETPIGAEETAGDLEARLAFEGARALVDVLDALAAGTLAERPQDELAASYFGKLSKADGALDWTRGADALARRVRAMTPWPGAWFLRGDETIRVWRARALAGAAGDPSSDEPGAVLGGTREGVAVATGAGTLEILEIQPPGGRRMSAAAYGRGRPWIPGEPLGPR